MILTTSPTRVARATRSMWPWLAPFVVALLVYKLPGPLLARLVTALASLVVVLLAARRPDLSLLALFAGLPFHTMMLAQVYAWGAPAGVVRALGGWKEALAIGVVIAGVRGWRSGSRRLDRIDVVALVYVAIVAAYAVVPELFAPGAPSATNARSLGFRATAGFVVLALAARHARLPSNFTERATRVVLTVGVIVAGIAVYEYFFSASWNQFVVERVHYVRYQVDILGSAPFSATDIRRYGFIGGQRLLRTGSVFLDPTPCAFFLLLPLAVAIERGLRTRARGATLALVVIAGALLLTQTRAALVGGLVIAFLALGPAAGRLPARRVQLACVFAAALLVVVPVASAIGLSERVSTTTSGDQTSSIDHVESVRHGIDVIAAKPLGSGLGTSAGVGQRFAADRATVTEDAYLQVGVETGLIAMALFIALTVLVLVRLRRAARVIPDIGVAVTSTAGIGLAVGGLALHVWSEFAVAWTFWGLAGAALAVAANRGASASVPPRLTEATR